MIFLKAKEPSILETVLLISDSSRKASLMIKEFLPIQIATRIAEVSKTGSMKDTDNLYGGMATITKGSMLMEKEKATACF
jgi:hypothetical protein